MRLPLPPALVQDRVVAVLRATHAREYAPVVEALVAGGIRSIELTLSTEGVFDLLPDLVGYGCVGVGTVTTRDEAERALDGGAAFLVTPTFAPSVVAAGVDRGVPVLSGGFTPTELHAGWQAGAAAVKLFPASTVGTGYLAQLRGPFPGMPVVPSGGVGVDDAAGWIRAGSVAVSVGGPLLQDAFRGGSLPDLTARSEALLAAVAAVGTP